MPRWYFLSFPAKSGYARNSTLMLRGGLRWKVHTVRTNIHTHICTYIHMYNKCSYFFWGLHHRHRLQQQYGGIPKVKAPLCQLFGQRRRLRNAAVESARSDQLGFSQKRTRRRETRKRMLAVLRSPSAFVCLRVTVPCVNRQLTDRFIAYFDILSPHVFFCSCVLK